MNSIGNSRDATSSSNSSDKHNPLNAETHALKSCTGP